MDELMVTIPIEEYKEMLGKIYDYNALMSYLYRCQDEQIRIVNQNGNLYKKSDCRMLDVRSDQVDIFTGSDLLRQIDIKYKEKEPASEDTDSNE